MLVDPSTNEGVFGRTKMLHVLLTNTLQLSAQTTADRLRLALTQSLIKRGRLSLGAPKGKRVQ